MNVLVKSIIEGSTACGDWQTLDDAITSLFPARQIKRVLLVNPPDADAEIFRYETARRGRYTNYPPYGLGILAENLRRANIDVQILNLNHLILKHAQEVSLEEFNHTATWTAALDEAIKEFEPHFIGLTCMFTMTHSSLKLVCQRASQSGVPIGIGGVHVTNDVDRILDDIPEANIAFLREGDQAILRFVEAVNGTCSLAMLGQVIFNLPASTSSSAMRYHIPQDCRPTEDDISVIPAFDLMDVPEYSQYGTIGAFYCFKPKGTVFSTILSNRGCRAQCTFCSVHNFNGSGVRQRDIIGVVDEIQKLKEEFGVEHIMWLDDDLLKDERRAIAMFNEITKRNLGITWDATNGLIASSCTEEVVAAMAASGCIAVNIGMESGNSDILRKVKKPGTVKNFIAAGEVFRKYEQIHTSILLIVGFPNETLRMVNETLDVATAMDCDWYRISPLQPLPNTPIYDAMVAQGLIQDVGSKELRFMGGGFGKQTEIEQGLRMAELGFRDAFSSIPLDAIPTKDQITDLWFYMNYHLNFHRLFSEMRPVKIRQQMLNLKVLSEVISPENGFALYFQGVLEYRLNGSVPASIIERLGRRLETSPYWADRFSAFGLSLSDLETADFKNKHIPRLLPMGIQSVC